MTVWSDFVVWLSRTSYLGWANMLVEVLKVIAWPGFALAFALIFKEELKKLIERGFRFRIENVGEIDTVQDRVVEAAATVVALDRPAPEQTGAGSAEPPPLESTTLSRRPHYTQSWSLDRSWRDLESLVGETAAAHSVTPLSAVTAANDLAKSGVLSLETAVMVERASEAYAAHRDGGPLHEATLLLFEQTTKRIADRIRAEATPNK